MHHQHHVTSIPFQVQGDGDSDDDESVDDDEDEVAEKQQKKAKNAKPTPTRKPMFALTTLRDAFSFIDTFFASFTENNVYLNPFLKCMKNL